MDETTLAAYLERIGAPRPQAVDAAALRALHRAHLMTVPFENLSIHLSEPISLDEEALLGKIVTRRRGGFCYELNGAFALLLEALGASVERVAARVYGEGRRLSPPFDHLALIVHTAGGSAADGSTADGSAAGHGAADGSAAGDGAAGDGTAGGRGPWLADVGFGSHSTYPLRFGTGTGQDDPAGRFLLAEAEHGDVDVFKDGEPQYRIERRGRSLADFGPTCWWQQTSPQSHFTAGTICSRLTSDGGRVSISGHTLIRTVDGTRTEQDLPTGEDLLAAYRDHFGLVLDQVPAASPG